MTEHDAVILKSRGAALVVSKRPTPNPGPNDILVEVKSIAFNPVDHIQQSMGFHISSYPYILGFDIAGVVKAVGSNVPSDAPGVGARVAANASSWFSQNLDHGAFQSMVLVSCDNVTVIPDSITFNQASMLPLATTTAWFSFFTLGLARDTMYTESDKKGILIWGVGGSVGSCTLQIAKSMGFYVYATASQKHHTYLQELGKGPGKIRLFDYKDKGVVEKIIKAAKDDGVKIQLAIEACAGNLKDCLRILRESKEDKSVVPKLAAAPFSFALLWYRMVPTWWSGASVKFVEITSDEKTGAGDLHFIFRSWLQSKLTAGEFVPSPKVQVVEGGLSGIQNALEVLKKGVSGVKLVVELP